MFTANELGLYKNKKFRMRKKKKVKKGLTTLVAAIVFFGMIAIIGGVAADPTPPQVTNASANPSVIIVNTGISELRVDVADIESPIDVVTVDLSHIGGNASTVMFNIGNYTQDNISWTMYNYTTNASVEGTFNLTVNATDINGNYNDTVSITLEVKKIIKIEIAFSGDMVISNITFDALIPSPKGTEKHRRCSCVVEFGNVWVSRVRDQTNWSINVRGERCSIRSIRIKQLVTRRKGVEVANLTFDPGFVMFPLFGITGTTTTNVTGMLVTETGAVIPIDTIAAVSGKGLSVVIEIDCSCDAMGLPTSHLEKYRISQMDHGTLFPKLQLYLNGTLLEELELIEIVMPPTFLTAADDGSEIELKKGQLLVITLEANPTTGYTWGVAEPLDEQVIRQVGEIEFVPESDLIGAGGVQIIRFEGVGAGRATIKLVYHRPWETEVELTRGTFSVQEVVH